VNIVENSEEAQDIVLTTLEAGDFWGEQALFGQDDIQLSAITDSPCTILELSGVIIRSLAKKRAQILEILRKSCKRWMFYPTLARVPLFKYFTDKERQKITEYFSLVNVKKGTAIITEGELDESLYLIKSGEVGVYTTFVEREGLQVIQTAQTQLYLDTLRAGDFFGEAAFLTKEPSIATVSTLTDVQLLKLPKPHLEQLIKNYPEIEKILIEYHQQRMLNNMKAIYISIDKRYFMAIVLTGDKSALSLFFIFRVKEREKVWADGFRFRRTNSDYYRRRRRIWQRHC
jgi:CRP-like cAMP-binding protein